MLNRVSAAFTGTAERNRKLSVLDSSARLMRLMSLAGLFDQPPCPHAAASATPTLHLQDSSISGSIAHERTRTATGHSLDLENSDSFYC